MRIDAMMSDTKKRCEQSLPPARMRVAARQPGFDHACTTYSRDTYPAAARRTRQRSPGFAMTAIRRKHAVQRHTIK